MANTHSTLTGLFTNIADAIREKKNTTETIIADTFPTEIENLKTGFDYVNQDVTVIPDEAFYRCEDIRSVNCYNLTSIGASAFENCTGFKTVILYDGVQSVGENAFKGCDCIIYCETESKSDGWHENWNPDNCEVVWGFVPVETWDISATENDNVIAKLYNDVQNDGYYSLIISGSGDMKDYGYSRVPWANYKNNINNVSLLLGITRITSNAFHSCTSLTSVTIPDSVTSIGDNAFKNCTSLTSIIIPDSVTNIGDNAFLNCINLQYNLYNNMYYLGSQNNPYFILIALNNDNLTHYQIHKDTKHICNTPFYKCNNIESIELPFLGGNIYINNNNIPSDKNVLLRYFGYIFDYKSYVNLAAVNSAGGLHASFIVSNSVTHYARFNIPSSLESVIISDGITEIRDCAFNGCESLTSITIPNSVIKIGNNILQDSAKLISINYIGTVAQWNAIAFSDYWNYNTGNYTIHCTDGDITKDGTITYHSNE